MPLCDPSRGWRTRSRSCLKSPRSFVPPGRTAARKCRLRGRVQRGQGDWLADSATRTPVQTHAAVFWQTNGAANFNAIARRFVDEFSLDVSDSARLFAMLDLRRRTRSSTPGTTSTTTTSGGRSRRSGTPTTAIRRRTPTRAGRRCSIRSPPVATAAIGPALITPPYPDHVSGATAYASASMHAFTSFFGTDKMHASISRAAGSRPTRRAEQRIFTRFSDVTDEVLEARIWAGIHFRTADVQAAELGREVERYIHKHLFASHTETRVVERPSGRSTLAFTSRAQRSRRFCRDSHHAWADGKGDKNRDNRVSDDDEAPPIPTGRAPPEPRYRAAVESRAGS